MSLTDHVIGPYAQMSVSHKMSKRSKVRGNVLKIVEKVWDVGVER